MPQESHARKAGFWSHLQTLSWLRWRLARNQLERGGTLNKVVSLILLLSGVGLSLAASIGGLAGGYLGLAKAPAWVHLLVWDLIAAGFLFFWMLSMLIEVQRSESIDMARLLHLPVSPKQVFFLNYLASHLSPVLILTVPGLLGLSLGMVLARGPAMGLLPLSLLGFLFMVTAWTYCLRGWIARLMINKRRRRAIIVGFTIGIILLSQLPNLYLNVFREKNHRPRLPKPDTAEAGEPRQQNNIKNLLDTPMVTKAHQWVPFLWLPAGARGLAENNPWPALLGFLGSAGLGIIGLRRAYRSTMGFYRGTYGTKKTRPPIATKESSPPSMRFMEYRLPMVSDKVSCLALTSFRNLLRAPETKMSLVFPFIMMVVFGSMLFRQQPVQMELFTPFIPTGLIFFLLFSLIQIGLNQFGFDRAGFRGLVLLPVNRRDILWGKNLALLGLILPVFSVMMLLMVATGRLSWDLVLSGFVQFGAGFVLLCLVGNWASILAPYRVAMGSLRKSKTKSTVSLVMAAFTLTFPLAMLPLGIPPFLQVLFHALGVATGVPIALLSSIPLLLGSLILYSIVLKHQGRLLQSREQTILNVVTHEQE